MEQKNFFDADTYAEIVDRVERLTQETVPDWGTMNSAQMCAHCSEVAEVAHGKALDSPWYLRLMGGFIKRMVLSARPFPRSTRTHPQYEIGAEVDFNLQKARLIEVLDAMYSAGRARAGETRHPLFGDLSPDEQGWLTYKHLDHHLTQFGV